MASGERRHANETYCTEATTARNLARSIASVIQASPNADFRRASLHIIRQWHATSAAPRAEPPSSSAPLRRSERLLKQTPSGQQQPQQQKPPPPTDGDDDNGENINDDRPNNRLGINAAIRRDVLRRLHATLIGHPQ